MSKEEGRVGSMVAISRRAEWFRRATEPSVLTRAVVTCLIVGSVLVAINHGDAIARGELGADRLLRIGLTFLVPFLVSMASSAAAIGGERRRRVDAEDRGQPGSRAGGQR